MAKVVLTKRQQFWLSHIQAAMRGGERLQQYARGHGLSAAALYNAKSLLKRAGVLKSAPRKLAASAFVPVQMAAQAPAVIRCRLQHRDGWQLEMERLPDPIWLRELLRGERDAAA